MYDNPETIFARHNAVGTIILLGVFALMAFIIACLLGLFIDPSMSQGTRIEVVIGAVVLDIVFTLVIATSRHA